MASKKIKESAEKLLEDSQSQFQANIAATRAGAEQFGLGRGDNLPNNQVVGGDAPTTHGEPLPDFLRGVPRANYPGVQPKDPQDTFGQGRKDNAPGGKQEPNLGRTDAAAVATQSQVPNEPTINKAVGNPAPVATPTQTVNPNQSQVVTPGQVAIKYNYNEDVNAMLSGEELSEEFHQKAVLIFESAVIARSKELVETQVAEISEKLVEEFESTVALVKEELEEKVSEYADYVASEYIKENQLEVERGLRTELTEEFMLGLRNLFIEHNIDIPENKVDLVEALTEKVESLEEQLNAQIETNVRLTKEMSESKKDSIVEELTSNLTLTQANKIKNISESVDFDSEDGFRGKLKTILENYFPVAAKPSEVQSQLADTLIVEDTKVVEAPKPTKNSDVSFYTKQIRRDVNRV